MAVFQHYYTSYVNRETGSAGFQVKAMSPGIAADTQSTITRLISYRIPSRLDEYAISTHPVALRYYYRNPQEAILLCSQSNGTDENGRPGNFFAHSLVVEPDFFASMPPILYWRSPFWRTKDPGSSAVIEPIESLEEIATALDIEGVWHFLAQGKRIEQFHKLMSAVVHCNSTQRRIVIIDNADNVAQWIAAITIMLPPDYRPLLSFATYHHDPYQSQFMVTGTTSDSSFRASPEEYMSYFILNTQNGKISDVEASPYADEAVRAARSYEIYESKLLSLITDTVPRFQRPTRIDEQLDSMALYAGMLEPNHAFSLNREELEAISVVLTTFEQMRVFTQEDLDEVRQISYLLQETSWSQSAEDIDVESRRVVTLLRKHKAPTEQSALREIKYITQHLINDVDISSSLQRLENMRQIYGEDLLIDIVNSTNYLQWLNKLAETINAAQLSQIWKYLAVYLNPGPHSQPFTIASLTIVGILWSDKQAQKDVRRAIEAMVQAMAGQEAAWLELIAANYNVLPDGILLRYYCWMMVGRFPLDNRLPYREIVQRVIPHIIKNELVHEISKAGEANSLAILEEWVDHARKNHLVSLTDLLIEGIKRILRNTPDGKAPEMAAKILVNERLAPLPTELENDLVSTAISQVSLSHYSPLVLELCKKYRNRHGLSSDIRAVMDGLIAMSSGELDEELAKRLQDRFASMRPEAYEADTKSFVTRFLQVCTTGRSHQLMINTFFDWDYPKTFWQVYWRAFTGLLTYPDTSRVDQAMKLLSFWFSARPDDFESAYLLHNFLMDLPQKLEEVQETRGFQEAARYINSRAESERWYPLVQDYFSGRTSALQTVGRTLATHIQKLRAEDSEKAARQAEKEQRERAALDERISAMFDKRKSSQYHLRIVGDVYEWQQRELFWSIYWSHFKSLFTSENNAQCILDLFHFWFDDSFSVLPQKGYIPRQFFLKLHDALMEAQKERGFRELARNIFRIGKQQVQVYPWFVLIQPYLEEQEKRFGIFRR